LAEKGNFTNDLHNPVAIVDKELLSAPAFTLHMFESCTICRARFGIGYHCANGNDAQATDETGALPRGLMEILAKGHRQNRAHKCFIELGV
jgi:hypothetical protein